MQYLPVICILAESLEPCGDIDGTFALNFVVWRTQHTDELRAGCAWCQICNNLSSHFNVVYKPQSGWSHHAEAINAKLCQKYTL